MDAKEMLRLLRRSADVAYYKGQMILLGTVTVIFALLAAICAIATGSPVFWVVLLPSAVICVPLILWGIYHLCHIFKNVERYRFFEETMAHPQSAWGRSMYFVIQLEGRTVETRAIFHAYGLLAPQFNDYIDQKALIGYNDVTEELVVIRKEPKDWN